MYNLSENNMRGFYFALVFARGRKRHGELKDLKD
jgi:hypothetical protein